GEWRARKAAASRAAQVVSAIALIIGRRLMVRRRFSFRRAHRALVESEPYRPTCKPFWTPRGVGALRIPARSRNFCEPSDPEQIVLHVCHLHCSIKYLERDND